MVKKMLPKKFIRSVGVLNERFLRDGRPLIVRRGVLVGYGGI